MDKYDLPPQPKPKDDADLYEGEQLPDVSSFQEFIEPEADWSEDISDYEQETENESDCDCGC